MIINMCLHWPALTSFESSQSAPLLNFNHSSAIELLSRGGTGGYFDFSSASVSSLLGTINEARQGSSSFSKIDGFAVIDDDEDNVAADDFAGAAADAPAVDFSTLTF